MHRTRYFWTLCICRNPTPHKATSDNVWFCNLLLLFSINMKTNAGIKTHECAYVSVLEEYKGPRRPGHILHIMYIVHIIHILFIILINCCTAWLDACQSTIEYEHSESAQVLYVILVSFIWGRLHLVPVSNTGTIQYKMWRESAYFTGTSSDTTKDSNNSFR